MIPRLAHMIWLGPPMPDYLAECVESFRRVHPHWELRMWDESSIPSLVNQDIFDNPTRWVPEHSRYQLASDVARLEILAEHGGMYVDCDFLWHRPIDDHLEGDLVTAWERKPHHVANGFIAARPEHPAIAAAITQTRRASHRTYTQASRFTGPSGVWTRVAKGARATILDQHLLLDTPWDKAGQAGSDPHPEAVASHLWHHQRVLRGVS